MRYAKRIVEQVVSNYAGLFDCLEDHQRPMVEFIVRGTVDIVLKDQHTMKEVIEGMGSTVEMTAKVLIEAAAKIWSVDVNAIPRKGRSRPVVEARRAVWHNLRSRGYGLAKIGAISSAEDPWDHSTVLFGLSRLEEDMLLYGATRDRVDELKRVVAADA